MMNTKSRGKNINVAFKLLLSVFAVVFLIVGIQTWLSVSNARQRNEADTQQALLALYSDYSDEVVALEKASAVLALSLADRPDIQELFLTRDREGLLSRLTPVFDTLAADYNIVHLYVHQPNGIVFVRIHNPERYGDDVTYRRTVAAVLQSRETVAGVEIGPNRLGIRSVAPIFYQGEFIGLIEVGLDYDQAFIEDLKVRHGVDYKMWVTFEAATVAGLSPTGDAPKPPSDKLFYYAGTNLTPLPIPTEVYNSVLQSGDPVLQFVSTSDDEELAVLIAPMLGYSDRIVGILEMSLSQAEALAALQRSQLITLAVAGGLTLLALILMAFTINVVVLRSLRHLTAVARRQLEGDLTARVELLPNDEFGQLGHTFNGMTEQLSDAIGNLEQRVAARTQRLEIVAILSERLMTILDLDQLLVELVNQVQESFGYYHAHIYVIDDEGQNLVMTAGVGEAGAEMKARGHHIPLNAPTSLVARAARIGQIVVVDNVRERLDWLPNPLLPDAWAEIAVPIIVDEQVIGVLDVQEDEIAGLDEGDVNLLRSLANQAAVAIRNARLFTEVETALAEARATQEQYQQLAWADVQQMGRSGAYDYRRSEASLLDAAAISRLEQAAMGQSRPVVVAVSDSDVEQRSRGAEEQGGRGVEEQGSDAALIGAKVGDEEDGAKIQQTKNTKIQNALVAPIKVQDYAIGAIQLHETEAQAPWGEQELALVQAVADQVAQAAENLRLFEETRRRASYERLAGDIAQKLRQAPTLEALTKIAGEELGKAIGASHSLVKVGLTPEQVETGNGERGD